MDKRYKIIKNINLNIQEEKLDIDISSIRDHVSEKININFDLVSGSEIVVTMFNVLGKTELFIKNQYNAGLNTIKFCTAEFKKGLYYLEMISEGKKMVMNVWIR